LQLAARARTRGLGRQLIDAVKEIDRRLHIYPQFGDPLRDLESFPATLYIAVVPPITVRYLVDEQSHLVIVATRPTPLPGSGLEE
jgi:hypothetical protein